MEQESEDEEQEIKGDSEQLDFSKPDFVFKPKEHHDWRQQGPYLVCKSCDIEHAVFVGMERQLTGLNEQGQPILKAR